MLVLGQVLTAVGLLFASTAHSYIAFILLLIAAGFGYGVLNPTSTKAVMAWSPTDGPAPSATERQVRVRQPQELTVQISRRAAIVRHLERSLVT